MWWVEYILTEDLQWFSFSIKAGWMRHLSQNTWCTPETLQADGERQSESLHVEHKELSLEKRTPEQDANIWTDHKGKVCLKDRWRKNSCDSSSQGAHPYLVSAALGVAGTAAEMLRKLEQCWGQEHWALQHTQDIPVATLLDLHSAPSKGLALHSAGCWHSTALLPPQGQLQPGLPSVSLGKILSRQLPPHLHALWNPHREKLELPNLGQSVKIWSLWYLWVSLAL